VSSDPEDPEKVLRRDWKSLVELSAVRHEADERWSAEHWSESERDVEVCTEYCRSIDDDMMCSS